MQLIESGHYSWSDSPGGYHTYACSACPEWWSTRWYRVDPGPRPGCLSLTCPLCTRSIFRCGCASQLRSVTPDYAATLMAERPELRQTAPPRLAGVEPAKFTGMPDERGAGR